MNKGTKVAGLKPAVQRRLNQYDDGDWAGLITNYKADVIVDSLIHTVDRQSQDNKNSARIWRAADLLSRSQYRKTRKQLQSNKMVNHRDLAIIEQIQRKRPVRKEDIIELVETELGATQKGINQEVFDLKLKKLMYDVAPGMGCLRNEHRLAFLFSSERQVTPSA